MGGIKPGEGPSSGVSPEEECIGEEILILAPLDGDMGMASSKLEELDGLAGLPLFPRAKSAAALEPLAFRDNLGGIARTGLLLALIVGGRALGRRRTAGVSGGPCELSELPLPKLEVKRGDL